MYLEDTEYEPLELDLGLFLYFIKDLLRKVLQDTRWIGAFKNIYGEGQTLDIR